MTKSQKIIQALRTCGFADSEIASRNWMRDPYDLRDEDIEVKLMATGGPRVVRFKSFDIPAERADKIAHQLRRAGLDAYPLPDDMHDSTIDGTPWEKQQRVVVVN